MGGGAVLKGCDLKVDFWVLGAAKVPLPPFCCGMQERKKKETRNQTEYHIVGLSSLINGMFSLA
jgi:hypothetical protein